MAEMYENSVSPEKVLIIGVDTGEYDAEDSARELTELVRTAGGEVFGMVIQKRDKPDNVSYIGAGKLNETKDVIEGNEIDLAVCDCELSPNQQKFLEKFLDVRVIDRTTLILDIFASNARSGEGKLQVELAQLKYMLPRLTGRGASMSRLGGGIGTRGPGESKLESDKRHIRSRIHKLEEELEELSLRRERGRQKRKKDGMTSIAIVGYTNAGKSTLLNCLTDAGVLAENKLFATLDPTARGLKLPNGQTVMLIDTVGFISRLPHFLVEAFKSTLEEASSADLILTVCDISDDNCEKQLEVTEKILADLGAGNTPRVIAYNKCDRVILGDFVFGKGSVPICALTGEGMSELLEEITKALPQRRTAAFLFPYSDGGKAEALRKSAHIFSDEYTQDGIFIRALCDMADLGRYAEYIVPAEEREDGET